MYKLRAIDKIRMTKVKCPKCGKTAYVDETILIATIPPKCYIHCEECNNLTLIHYDDISLYKEEQK